MKESDVIELDLLETTCPSTEFFRELDIVIISGHAARLLWSIILGSGIS